MSADNQPPADEKPLSDKAQMVLGYISTEEYERRQREAHHREMRAGLRLVVDNTKGGDR